MLALLALLAAVLAGVVYFFSSHNAKKGAVVAATTAVTSQPAGRKPRRQVSTASKPRFPPEVLLEPRLQDYEFEQRVQAACMDNLHTQRKQAAEEDEARTQQATMARQQQDDLTAVPVRLGVPVPANGQKRGRANQLYCYSIGERRGWDSLHNLPSEGQRFRLPF